MLVRQMLEIYDLLDTPQASGEAVAALLRERGAQDVTVTVVGGNQGTTDCVKVVIPGRHGKSTGGDAPTLGIDLAGPRWFGYDLDYIPYEQIRSVLA